MVPNEYNIWDFESLTIIALAAAESGMTESREENAGNDSIALLITWISLLVLFCFSTILIIT